MPKLISKKYEIYARARAMGADRVTAHAEAGYQPHSSAAGRIERRPEVAARLAELRARDTDEADPAAVVVRLLRLADACEAQGGAPALKEARLALLEARRLQAQISEGGDEYDYEPLRPEMTEEQWILRYGNPEAKQEVLTAEWRDKHDRHGWRADDAAAIFTENGW